MAKDHSCEHCGQSFNKARGRRKHLASTCKIQRDLARGSLVVAAGLVQPVVAGLAQPVVAGGGNPVVAGGGQPVVAVDDQDLKVLDNVASVYRENLELKARVQEVEEEKVRLVAEMGRREVKSQTTINKLVVEIGLLKKRKKAVSPGSQPSSKTSKDQDWNGEIASKINGKRGEMSSKTRVMKRDINNIKVEGREEAGNEHSSSPSTHMASDPGGSVKRERKMSRVKKEQLEQQMMEKEMKK